MLSFTFPFLSTIPTVYPSLFFFKFMAFFILVFGVLLVMLFCFCFGWGGVAVFCYWFLLLFYFVLLGGVAFFIGFCCQSFG